ncbi:hypothetical protein AVEN_194582-1 [Araneus ventricosus]|uniref:Uncharacterized protein n=1 Tax=Araneus ventricosus TaxID=182803 RepID=A0A4Y2A7J6_ARAVE|nr:hypothetical protein AVEN_194582-1 [Araneus ventricosus]
MHPLLLLLNDGDVCVVKKKPGRDGGRESRIDSSTDPYGTPTGTDTGFYQGIRNVPNTVVMYLLQLSLTDNYVYLLKKKMNCRDGTEGCHID